MENIDKLKAFLSEPKQLVIIPHQKPDADALGSAHGLSLFLQKKGHSVQIISPTDYPQFLAWMPQDDKIIVYKDKNKDQIDKIFEQSDMVFCLDFSELSRCKPLDIYLTDYKKPITLIDHHRGTPGMADYKLWDINAAATAELIYDFIGLLEGQDDIDIPIAECIYAGLMTDTGSFKHPSTSSKVHRIAAELMDLGMNAARVHNLVYDNNSENKLRLLGHALLNCLVVKQDVGAAYFLLSQDDLKRFDFRTGDSEGLVNYALSIQGIQFAATIIDHGDSIRCSFRSIGNFSVADFARQHFEGGGHFNASGGIIRGEFKDAATKFEDAVAQHAKELKSYL
ncbi:MAG: bifunctional oligoribonuclease/PAP phosphatase NrnA [Bernardetiaceae bacterium]|nr:bifunctional oligoribonuclease/PAP phosphatase NrnA [Bernardetiaceae bacterium]